MNDQKALDKFDIAILRALQRNSRASLQELSAEVGLSSSPCWTRVKRMEEAGVIEGYTIGVNSELPGCCGLSGLKESRNLEPDFERGRLSRAGGAIRLNR